MIDEKLLLVQNKWAGQIVCKLRAMQKSGQSCDMLLEADTGEVVPCHSCIMVANIPSLEQYVRETDPQLASAKTTVRERLKGLSQKTIEQVVLFCYGGFLEVLSSDLTQVLVAAKQLCFDQLVEACKLLLRQKNTGHSSLSGSLGGSSGVSGSAMPTTGKKTRSAVRRAKENVVNQTAKALESLEQIIKVESFEECISVVVSDKHEPELELDVQKVWPQNCLVKSTEVKADNEAGEENGLSSENEESEGAVKRESVAEGFTDIKETTEAASDNDSEATDIMEDVEEEADVDDEEEEKQQVLGRKQRKKLGRTAKKEYTCGLCDKVLASNCALRDHMNGHNGLKPYKCPKCEKCFAARGSLKEHRSVHKGLTFPCDKCGKIFSAKKQMMRHWKNHPSDYVPKSSRKQQECKCDLCGKVFSHLKSLSDHINIHKGLKPYKCDLCEKSYSVEASLVDHKIKHRSKELPCRYCGKLLPTQKKLRKHVRCHGEKVLEQANEEARHKCDQCGKLFHSPFNLKQHIKQTHMNVVKTSQYICQVCGKILKTKHGMDLHVVGCTDKGQFQCDFCIDKHYVTKSGLDKHITWAHRTEMMSSEKYSKHVKLCKYCGQSFLCRALLMEHEKTHSKERNYKCETCGKTFKTHNNVLTHKRNVHVMSENRFHCDVCNTWIKSSGAFKRHKRMHLTQPVHQCDHCGKGYNRKDMLNQHILNCNSKQYPAKQQLAQQQQLDEQKGMATSMSAPYEAGNYNNSIVVVGAPPSVSSQKGDPLVIAPKEAADHLMYMSSQPPPQQHNSEVAMFQLPPLPGQQSLAHVQQHYGLTQVEQSFCRL